MRPRMDAVVPMDAQNAPTGPWKTAQNAVSHSVHTHHRFRDDEAEEHQKTTTSTGFTHKLPDRPIQRLPAAECLLMGARKR